MKNQVIAQAQGVSRVHHFYQDDYHESVGSWLRPDEAIVWVGNHSYCFSEYDGYLGYLVISSFRLFLVRFKVSFGLFSGRMSIADRSGHFAVRLPSKPLTAGEREKKTVKQVSLRDITSVERSEHQAMGTSFVRLRIRLKHQEGAESVTLYSLQDGQEVYEILQDAILNSGIEVRNVPDIADQLTKLAKLFQDKAITAEEYEAAKTKLLR